MDQAMPGTVTAPATLAAKTRQAEDNVAWVRAGIVVFNVGIYWGYLDHAGTNPALAALVSVVATLYSFAVLVAHPQHRWNVLETAWWTAATDAALIVGWIMATGGATSAFAPLWAVSLVAIGFRFGPRSTLVATAIYIGLDTLILSTGAWHTGNAAVRLTYIGFTGVMVAMMSSFAVDGVQRQERLAEATARLAYSESHLQAITQNAPSIIIMADRTGCIEYINRTIGGMTTSDVISRNLIEFVPEDQAPVMLKTQRAVLADGKPRSYQLQAPGEAGVLATWQTHMGAVRDESGSITGLVLLSMDVTTEHQREKEAAKARRLQEEAKFRARFINAAAHELNTPMTPIKLQLAVLHRRLAGEADERTARSMAVLQRNIDRLAALNQDLLTATRLQSQPLTLNLAEVDVAQLVHEVVESFEETAQARGTELDVVVAGPAVMKADALRVSQILYNLMSNALKFTPDGRRIKIEAGRYGGQFQVRVQDEGPGFTAEQIHQLFQPFTQVHPSPRPDEPGTGLGLYISKNLADSHGGSLTVSSPGPDDGATFELALPLVPSARHEPAPAGP